MGNRITPNHREAIGAIDSATGIAGYPTMTNRKLDVNATSTISGSPIPVTGATTAIVTAIVDGSGNQITSFGSPSKSTTGTQTSVSGSATNVTLLASNSSRLGGTISNDSTAVLYLKMGTTASTTSYSVKLFQDDYFEIPYNYVGELDGIWASATGAARITELS